MNYKSAAVFSRNPVDAERAGLRDPYRALDHQTTSNKSRNDSEKLSRSVQYSFKWKRSGIKLQLEHEKIVCNCDL